MAEPARRPATYDDLLAVSSHLVAEIINGVLHTQPRPAPRHAAASSVLVTDLNGPFQRGRGGPGGWWILHEPELHLGSDVLVPDLAGWRRQRMPRLPDTAWFGLAPDWVCEVLSPSNALRDRALKLPIYAEHGVSWAWLVDPGPRSVEVFERQDQSWVLRTVVGEDARASLPPFEAVELQLADLWDAGSDGQDPTP